jgi:hypothetical protein
MDIERQLLPAQRQQPPLIGMSGRREWRFGVN